MTHSRAIAAGLLALASLPPALARAEVPAAASDPPFGARLAACHRSPRAQQRVAVVSAWMRPVAGATRLALRIELLERPLAGGPWSVRADVPGLGTWTSPADPSIGSRPADLFRYRQAVARLGVPFAYRFRVGFHWLDDAGRVVRAERRLTRACRQPDLRPDLAIPRVRVHPTLDPATLRYVVLVRNGGRSRTPAGVLVAATLPGDAAARTRTLPRLLPGDAVEVAFLGPGCPAGGTPPMFTVDPANAVEERDETNDAVTLACPVA